MSQFKPGDSVLIIFSNNPKHAGAVAEVLEVFSDTKLLYKYRGELHSGHADGGPLAFIQIPSGGIWMYRHRHLIPLRGDFAPEQQKSREVVA